jgi:hypothetical protein
MDDRPIDNPYKSPHGNSPVGSGLKGSALRFESLSQRLISVALLLVAFIVPFGLGALPTILSNLMGTTGDAVSYLTGAGVLVWVGAIISLIYRAARRRRDSAAAR